MIQSKRILILAFVIPILVLLGLTLYKKSVVSYGQQVTLPIEGYDPRDLLSGHYLIYRINYGVEGMCAGSSDGQTVFVCLEPPHFSLDRVEDCSKQIRGRCNGSRFEAGIEKYFVPEAEARILEAKVQSKAASIVLSIGPNGDAQVKDLLIEGRPWREQ